MSRKITNPLFKCIKENNIPELRKLIDNKSVRDNINKEYYIDFYPYTPLEYASYKGRKNCIKILLQAGANPNPQNHNPQNRIHHTALMIASNKGHSECVELLLRAGAKTDLQTRDGYTALIGASIYGYTECARLLLHAGANTNIKDKWNCTALMYASRYGKIDCVRLLLTYGTNPLLKNKDNKTAYDIATNETIKKLLKNAMKAYPVMSLLGPTFKKKTGLPADIGHELIKKYLFSKKNKKSNKKSKQYTSVLKSKTKTKKSKKRLNKI